MNRADATRPAAALAAATLTVTALAVFTGCSIDPRQTRPTAVLATPAPAPTITGSSEPAPPIGDVGAEPRTPIPAVTTRPTNQSSINAAQTARSAAAAATAETFMRAYARSTMAADEWRAALNPMLTETARATLQRIDPKAVTARAVTGTAVVLPSADRDARTVSVPTDDGDYTLLLRRDSNDTRWLVLAAQPPEIHHDE